MRRLYTLCPRCHGSKEEPYNLLPPDTQECVPCSVCKGTGLYPDQQISKYFRLREFIRSQTAVRRGIDNTPSQEIIENLKELGKDILDEIRKKFGPIHINSGYRSSDLNTAIGGSPTSSHLYGTAADIVPVRRSVSLKQIVDWVIEEKLLFDQVIFEGTWVHISRYKDSSKTPPRRMSLMMFNGKYYKYDPSDSRVLGVRK